jgi:hypothetical protein
MLEGQFFSTKIWTFKFPKKVYLHDIKAGICVATSANSQTQCTTTTTTIPWWDLALKIKK